MKDYSWEFKVITHLTEEIVVPVYEDLLEEEKEELRKDIKKDSKKAGLVPAKVKIGETIEERIIKKNAIYKRRVPDVRVITIHEVFNKKGKIVKNKFAVEESCNVKYHVKGNYRKFKKILDNITNYQKQIGFNGK